MRTLTGSLLQIPKYFIFGAYFMTMTVIFFVTAILSLPGYIVGQFKH